MMFDGMCVVFVGTCRMLLFWRIGSVLAGSQLSGFVTHMISMHFLHSDRLTLVFFIPPPPPSPIALSYVVLNLVSYGITYIQESWLLKNLYKTAANVIIRLYSLYSLADY